MSFMPRKNRILAALEKGGVALGMQVNTGDPILKRAGEMVGQLERLDDATEIIKMASKV